MVFAITSTCAGESFWMSVQMSVKVASWCPYFAQTWSHACGTLVVSKNGNFCSTALSID
jgi:hypothetical protein